MLEELNRAERYTQQPALQLLSARRLHEYVLPPGWACFAAINPPAAGYHVAPLDPALMARFLRVRLRADRAAWLAWALRQGLHPAVLALVREHDRCFEHVPPRSWTYVSALLSALELDELRDEGLLRDLLLGYLPAAWTEVLLPHIQTQRCPVDVDVPALLAHYEAGGPASQQIQGYFARGETDCVDEILHRLSSILQSPEAGVLASQKRLRLAALENLLRDLPGDYRERVQEAVGSNPTLVPLLEVQPAELLHNYRPQSPVMRTVEEWKGDPVRHYRLRLLVTALCAHLQANARATEVRKSNAARASLGHFLAQIGERWGIPLVRVLQKQSITPIRPQ